MRVFFFKKDIIIWGVILLAAIILLLVVLRMTGGVAEAMKQDLVSIIKGVKGV